MSNYDGTDFFTLLKELYIAALNFANDHPKYSKISNLFIRNHNHQLYHNIIAEVRAQAKEGYIALLKKGIEEGAVRSDINLDYMSYMLINISLSTMDYHFEVINQAKDVSLDSRMLSSFDLMFDLLTNGLKENN